MLRGLYESAVGMNARLIMQDVIANNLANVNSTGFQRELIAMQSRPILTGGAAAGAATSANSTQITDLTRVQDTRPGVQQETGNKGDIALSGKGYLVTQIDDKPQLFRSGSLRADSQGFLALTTGERVEGVGGGPIRVGTADWSISEQGNVEAEGKIVGRLRIVQVQGEMSREGSGFSKPSEAARITDLPLGSVQVRSGYLERSNVDTVHEMVAMIEGMRAYEAGQRAIQAHDQTLQSLFTLLQ